MADRSKKASPVVLAKAVFWSFLGIRGKKDSEADSVRLTPLQVIVAGLVGAALLVTGLVLLVKFIIGRVA